MEQSGVIIKAVSGTFDVDCGDGKVVCCKAPGRFRKDGLTPLVGDRAVIRAEDCVISDILPRKNELVRPPVANVDLLVVFASNVIPVTAPFLIDRVCAIAAKKEISVLICVNKNDLSADDVLSDTYRQAGMEVLQTSAKTGKGITELYDRLAGTFAVFTGNSGVGKSSVLNRLYEPLNLPVAAVSEKLGRGRHTTRHTEIYTLPNGARIADTPGFSSFDAEQYGVVSADGLDTCFIDFAPYLGHCRYADCVHKKEPDCAVREAVDAGKIAASRYESYLLLRDDLEKIDRRK